MSKKLTIFCCTLCLLLAVGARAKAAKITVGPHNIIYVDGLPAFPIGFTKGPPADSKTPWGTGAYEEMKTNGRVFHLAGPRPGKWGPEAQAALDHILARSAQTGFLTAISIPDIQAIGPNASNKADELRRVVERYRNNAGLGFWKAEDEPEWVKVPVPYVQRYYDIVHQLDPNHPVWLTQAPRGTVEALRSYNPAYDVGAIDIYPIGYPPGMHSLLPNKDISMVGDYAKELEQTTEDKKPFWMVLQVCWSGVAKPGKTLRFPTFFQERYMAYQSIIDGARGLVFFGGTVKPCLNARDTALGWNWTFYQHVLKRLLNQLNSSGPVFPALVAPESKLKIKLTGASDVEYRAREAGGYLYILAAKRQGTTVHVKFSGLPAGIQTGDVLFEAPRKVTVSNREFMDWFAPHDVHVYRFKEDGRGSEQ
jgi:hypothetical protein